MLTSRRQQRYVFLMKVLYSADIWIINSVVELCFNIPILTSFQWLFSVCVVKPLPLSSVCSDWWIIKCQNANTESNILSVKDNFGFSHFLFDFRFLRVFLLHLKYFAYFLWGRRTCILLKKSVNSTLTLILKKFLEGFVHFLTITQRLPLLENHRDPKENLKNWIKNNLY